MSKRKPTHFTHLILSTLGVSLALLAGACDHFPVDDGWVAPRPPKCSLENPCPPPTTSTHRVKAN